MWLPGDLAPDFTARSSNGNPKYNLGSAAGRYLVLCFFGSAALGKNLKAIEHMAARRDFFNDHNAVFFGISIDQNDELQNRVRQHIPGIRFFWDCDLEVSKLYKALAKDVDWKNGQVSYNAFTLILDPMMRVIACIPLKDLEQHNKAFDDIISKLPEMKDHAGVEMHAPVLILPRIFEPEFCRELISLFETDGGQESGFMRQVGDKTVGIYDSSFKRRKDYNIEDEKVMKDIHARFARCLLPMIESVFQFKVTCMERYLLACYDSESGGFFMPHRDNTTAVTGHRKFAVTINLNSEEYEGGDLRFPEFGQQLYRAPTGGAVVFSCSLLHEATPVTKGKRYAFLPFLYDQKGAELKEKTEVFLEKKTVDKNKGENEYAAFSGKS